MKAKIETIEGAMGIRAQVVTLGRRRARRIADWFGGSVRLLPSVGREVTLRDGIILRCWKDGRYDARGPIEALERLCLALNEQERVERIGVAS